MNYIDDFQEHRLSHKTMSPRVPTAKPPFSLGDLRKAVPSHCFERSLLKSFSYLIADLVVIAVLFYVTRFLDQPGPLGWMLWTAYWVAQGCVGTGVWVIAHECGHGAFSEYAWVDNLVGLVLHSCLLVPFFSWKYSHRRHHANNGSVERDEVFVPRMKEELSWVTQVTQHTPGRVLSIGFMLTLGWPSYLLLNLCGRKYERFASHYDPRGPIFNKRERLQVLVSDIALLVVCCGLGYAGSACGFLWLFKVYGLPLMVVNAWLVVLTFLQHTHPALPHYKDSEWDWVRGELVTVDRHYGILNYVFHHIVDTHVVHHFFSTMPHYHALEATQAIKPVLGSYYVYDSTPVPLALWREYKECVYVEPDSSEAGILWFKSKLI